MDHDALRGRLEADAQEAERLLNAYAATVRRMKADVTKAACLDVQLYDLCRTLVKGLRDAAAAIGGASPDSDVERAAQIVAKYAPGELGLLNHLVAVFGEIRGQALASVDPAPPADPMNSEATYEQVLEALWDLQTECNCWCDAGESSPIHSPACAKARRVSKAANTFLRGSPAPQEKP